jgi:hypothetical protein
MASMIATTTVDIGSIEIYPEEVEAEVVVVEIVASSIENHETMSHTIFRMMRLASKNKNGFGKPPTRY